MLRTNISSRRCPSVRWMLLPLLLSPTVALAQVGDPSDIPPGLRTRPAVRTRPVPGGGAQFPREPDTPELSDLRLQHIYESALSILERGDVVNGLPLLQSILDHPRDTLYYPDPQDRDQAVSLKGLVLERLNELPANQLEQYNVMYDPAAREILGDSTHRSAQATLEDVVRRYYFTETGRQAALRLAKMYFDRGNFLAAALTFQRLLEEDRVPARDRPLVLLQTAVALRLTGLDDKCRETLLRLKEEVQEGELKIGGRTLSLKDKDDDVLAWLDRMIAPGMTSARLDPQADWLMFRGNSQRNAESSGGPPLREQSWELRTIPIVETEDPKQLEFVERELQLLRERFAGSNYLQIPAMHPLIVEDRIVIRSLGNLKAIDLKSGDLLWESYVSNQSTFLRLVNSALDSFVNRDEQISELQEFIMQHACRDLRSGMLASDGTYVYAVEELEAVDPNQSRYQAQAGLNKLVAYELATGKATWTLNSPNKYREHFLGPPLVQGDILYCLVERNEEIFLIALRNHEPPDGYVDVETLWEQPLPLPVSSELDEQMPLWRLSGLTPSYANGMLICPIAHGTVVAYDLARGILAWQYRYPGEQFPSRLTQARLNRIRDQFGITREDENRWVDSVPTIARGRILLTPCDSPELHCLNLSTGVPYWTIPRGDDLYVGCVRGDRIVLVGRDQIHARDLETGAELWSVPIPMPSGRGYVSGSSYYVPLSTAGIAVVDLELGELRAVVPSQHNRVPGNLVAANGFVVSQTEDRVFRYSTEDEMQQQLKTAADTVDAAILRGELALLDGRTADAVNEFVKAYESHQSPRLRELLVQTLLDGLREDFDNYDQYLPQLRDLTRGTAEYPVFQEILAEGLSKTGQTAKAFSQFLSLLDQPLSRLDQRTARQRSDVWARGHLRELYERTAPQDRGELDQIVAAKVKQVLDEGPLKAVTRAEAILQDFPVSLDLQRARLAQLNEYTESLALELLLIRLSESEDASLRREAVGRHFQLLMKLERIEQAARVRDVLLKLYPDEVCVDEMTGTQLAEWGLENRLLREYLARRSHTWPQNHVVVTPTRARPDQIRDLYQIPVQGDPGLFAGWTFHFTNQKPSRLVILDEFGKKRSEFVLEASRHEPSNLSLNRSIHLRGHLAVLVLADEFFVLDLFQKGARSFLHGPHQLNEQMAGLDLQNVRDAVFTETVAGPNGHPQQVVRDMYNERLGQIAVVTTQMIVFQRDRELVALEALTGEELWSRQIGDHGQLLAADEQIVACRPMGQRTVSTFRLLDGKPVGQFELPERHYIFAVHGRILIALERSPSGGQQTDDAGLPDEEWQLTAYDPLLKKGIWSQPASPSILVQSADLDHLAVLDGKARQLRFIRVEDGEVLARHTIPVTGQPKQAEQPKQPEAEEPGKNAPPGGENPEEILAFWINPSRDGYFVTTVDRVMGEEGQVRVSALSSDRELVYHPYVHGEVLQLNRRGDIVWQRRVENQVYDPAQPQASPVVVFLSRHVTNRRRFITTTAQVAIEILNRQTGEQLFHQIEMEQHSQLDTEVNPEQQRVELSGNWNKYVITFGAEQSPGTPESKE